MSVILRAEGLGRWYGQVVGLSDLTVEIEGGITGLVGPNGAGKSTLMKLLVGEIRPSRGTVEVLGQDPFANRELYRRLGFCPQQDAFYDGMTGREFVSFLLRLSGYGCAEAKSRAVRALERLHLSESMDRRLAGYSKGMRQRTKIAQAIAHEPELLVVDEPLTGLDPVARHRVLELFAELGQAGSHVILSSHVLHEVESLTSTIVLIHRGRLLAQGGVGEVRKLLSRHPRKVRIVARDARRLAEALMRLEHVDSAALSQQDEQLDLETRDLTAFERDLPSVVERTRPGLRSLESADASLEAIFDYMVG